jgi:hypothetical protein
MNARSTGKHTRDEAVLVVAEWLKNGLPGESGQRVPPDAAAEAGTLIKLIDKTDLTCDDAPRIVKHLKKRGLIDTPAVKPGKGSALFIQYLETFWDYEKSPYVEDKLAHGQNITKRHCYECPQRVKRYRAASFEGKKTSEITREDLKALSIALSKKGLAVKRELTRRAGGLCSTRAGTITRRGWRTRRTPVKCAVLRDTGQKRSLKNTRIMLRSKTYRRCRILGPACLITY